MLKDFVKEHALAIDNFRSPEPTISLTVLTDGSSFVDRCCWLERADLLAAVCVVFFEFGLFPKCFLVHIRIKGEVGAFKLV